MPAIDPRQQLHDIGLTLGLFLLGVVAVYGAEAASTQMPDPDGLIGTTPIGIGIVAIGLAPVAVRRRWPLGALLASTTVYGITASTDRLDRLPLLVGLLVCLYTFAEVVEGPARRVGAGLAVAVALVSITVGLRWHGSDWFEWVRDGGLEVLGFLAAWVLGDATRTRAQLQRQLALRAAMAEEHAVSATGRERARIARELHDLVGHAISVISVQATVGEHLAESNPAQARASLATIHEMSQQAMSEMRHLVGVLRDGDADTELAPQPGLADIDALLAEARTAGTEVRFTTDGDPAPVSPGVGLAAYRVIQEALTNARKHAPGAPVELHLAYGQDGLALDIVNGPPSTDATAGQGATAAELGSSGFGLPAMRERVAVYHGTIQAEPTPTGGFRVHARLPYRDDDR